MEKTAGKKRKLVKTVTRTIKKTPQTKKPVLPQSANVTPKKQPQPQNPNSDSDSSEFDSDDLMKLLEPYSKDQLVDLICDAALKNSSLFSRIRETADQDVSHRKVFMHGLGWDTTRENVVAAFESFGEIEECTVVMDKNTGKAKGFGFVVFKTRKGAKKALKEPRKKINNRIASCQLASIGPVGQQQNQEMSERKIYVSNVQPDVDAEKLRAFFAKFGEIETGPIGFDLQTGKSRGFALFVYKTTEAAKKALQEPNKVFQGHQLNCRKAADGKGNNQVQGVQVQPQVQAPVLAALAAAQNMALFSQHPTLNPMYNALFSNQGGWINPMMAGTLNQGALGQGLIPTSQLGVVSGTSGLGGQNSGTYGVLGPYGTNAPQMQGLQYVYPNTQIGQSSSARPNGAKGSFSGYPSLM